MSEWRETRNGNYVYPLDSGEVMTVFQRPSGRWAGVHDDHFTAVDYDTPEEAMKVVEAAVLRRVDGLMTERTTPSHWLESPAWRKTKTGGWFKQDRFQHASVKRAKSSKWFVVKGTQLVEGRWFTSDESAKAYADEVIFGRTDGG